MLMANQHATAADWSHKLRLSSVPRAETPIVQPLHVFAARRKCFDVIVRSALNKDEAVAIIFRKLPLGEYGWDEATARLDLIGCSQDGFPIWRINRS